MHFCNRSVQSLSTSQSFSFPLHIFANFYFIFSSFIYNIYQTKDSDHQASLLLSHTYLHKNSLLFKIYWPHTIINTQKNTLQTRLIHRNHVPKPQTLVTLILREVKSGNETRILVKWFLFAKSSVY